jgi:hypothetical protein
LDPPAAAGGPPSGSPSPSPSPRASCIHACRAGFRYLLRTHFITSAMCYPACFTRLIGAKLCRRSQIFRSRGIGWLFVWLVITEEIDRNWVGKNIRNLLLHLVRFLDREDLVELAPDDQNLLQST